MVYLGDRVYKCFPGVQNLFTWHLILTWVHFSCLLWRACLTYWINHGREASSPVSGHDGVSAGNSRGFGYQYFNLWWFRLDVRLACSRAATLHPVTSDQGLSLSSAGRRVARGPQPNPTRWSLMSPWLHFIGYQWPLTNACIAYV